MGSPARIYGTRSEPTVYCDDPFGADTLFIDVCDPGFARALRQRHTDHLGARRIGIIHRGIHFRGRCSVSRMGARARWLARQPKKRERFGVSVDK